MRGPLQFALVVPFALTVCARSAADTIHVPGDHRSIQSAIDAAGDGDVVLVAPGTYIEQLRLGRARITLASHYYTTGDNQFIRRTVLDGGGAEAVIEIVPSSPPETTIVGFTIRNASDGVMARGPFRFLSNRVTRTKDGIDYEDRSGGLVRGCVFEGNFDDGLDLDDEAAVIIEHNTIRDNGQDGIEIRLHDYDGPPLSVVIRDNVISGNGEDGIQFIDYDRPSARIFQLERNLFAGNRLAAVGMMCCRDTDEDYQGAGLAERIDIVNNTFVGNGHGVTGGHNVLVLNNIFASTAGIALKRVDGNSVVAHNLFHQNATDFAESNVDPASVIRADPLLDAEYRPSPGSPALGAGATSYARGEETIKGRRDLGALHRGLPAPGGGKTARHAAIRFGRGARLEVGRRPEALAIGDLDHDGHLDIAVPNSKDGTISVLRGTGTGSFTSPVTYRVGNQPEAIVLDDFDENGTTDMAIANTADGTVSILMNRGNGTFGDPVVYPVGREPEALVAADLDGDGAPDLAVVNNADESVSVMYNMGRGVFAVRQVMRVGRDPESIAAADVDGKGGPDLIVVNSRDDHISVHRNNGRGAFAVPGVTYRVGRKPEDVAVGDLNGDGRPDLLVTNSGDGTISVLINTGEGTFGAARSYAVGQEPESVAVGDLDGDGRQDVAVANAASGSVFVLLNGGDCALLSPLTFWVGREPKALSMGDLDGNGRLDLAVADNAARCVTVLLNRR